MIDMAKKFFLRSAKSNGIAPLYIQVSKRNPQIRFTISTAIDVDIVSWNKANRSENAWRNFIMSDYGKEINEKLELVEKTINTLVVRGDIASNDDRTVAEAAIHSIAYRAVYEHEAKENKRKKMEEERATRSIIGFYDYFCKGIADGSIRHGDGNRYSKSSCVMWQSFGVYLRGYCKKETLTFDDVTKPFADKFCMYLEKNGMMATTINKYVGCFRKLCNLSAEMGINTNAVSLRVWKERTAHDFEKRAEVYLTDEELDALYKMRLHGEREQIRDLFILGCLTCQRYSDYSNLTKDNFKVLSDGIQVVSLYQQKTKNYVEVPVVDERVMAIAQKYSYSFPMITIRVFNRVIKEVAKDLSVSVPTLAEKYPTAVTLSELRSEQLYESLCARVEAAKGSLKCLKADEKNEYYKLRRYAKEHNGNPLWERNSVGEVIRPKYELISSHTARRSGVTNLYKTGLLDAREIMSISGHKTEKVFDKYIRLGVSEKAKRIAAKLRIADSNDGRRAQL